MNKDLNPKSLVNNKPMKVPRCSPLNVLSKTTTYIFKFTIVAKTTLN